MPRRVELCENCGAKLEVPHLWKRLVVCSKCFGELTSPQPANRPRRENHGVWLWVGNGAVLLALLAAGIVMIRSGNRPAPAPHRSTASLSHVGFNWNVEGEDFTTPATTPVTQSSDDSAAQASQTTDDSADTPTTATIAGTVLWTRRNGQVVPQSSLRVQLLRTTVRRSAAVSALATQAQRWRDLADLYADFTQQDSRPDADATTVTSASSTGQTFANTANLALNRLQAAISAVPQEVDTAGLLQTLSLLGYLNIPEFTDPLTDATLAETRTDANGTFQFLYVDPGDYYVHAVQATGNTFAEWCVPVRVNEAGEITQVNLATANASVVQDLQGSRQ